MKKKKNKIAHRLIQALRGEGDKIPSGWLTTRQWATKWECSRCHAGKLIKQMMDAKMLEMRRFRVRSDSGPLYPVPHYREKK